MWTIHSGLLARLAEHCCAEYPREACGALLGDQPLIRAAIPLPNVSATPGYRYEIDPLALARAAVTHRLVGLYHSHPDASPHFSRDDLAAGKPGWLYLVLSVRAGLFGGVQAWRPLNRRAAVFEDLEIT
jgi:proteasome lid subunit RPN8/RPN11